MKYNCLRINPYVKMFVVGLLLYLGETVFFKCSDEKEFTVKVMMFSGATIEVHNCKGTDELSEFMKKFEAAYDENTTGAKIKGRYYFLLFQGKVLYNNKPDIINKTLANYSIGENCTLQFGFQWLKGDEKLPKPPVVNTVEKNKVIHDTTEENAEPSTSTCPLRRCCRICGC